MSDKPQAEIQIGAHRIIVDAEDLPFLSRFTWSVSSNRNTFYALTNVKIGNKKSSVSMHRLITGLVNGQIDHKNRNGLDNRKSNLRFASKCQNSYNRIRKNSNGYRGVFKPKKAPTYAVQIQAEGKRLFEYGFKTAEDAARRYDELSKELHGEFGIRNFEE